jgi:SPP1 family predicted phage head-tail adaptor
VSNAALKRHRIDVEAPVETQDATGESRIEWYTYFAKEPADFTSLSGVESVRGRQLEAQTKATFKVNYRDGYTTKMRICFEGRIYGITHINPIGVMRRELEILVNTTA